MDIFGKIKAAIIYKVWQLKSVLGLTTRKFRIGGYEVVAHMDSFWGLHEVPEVTIRGNGVDAHWIYCGWTGAEGSAWLITIRADIRAQIFREAERFLNLRDGTLLRSGDLSW